MNVGKATKAESKGGATSQPPRGAASTKQRSGEEQRLRGGMELKANLSKQSRWWIPDLISWERGQYKN
jgi:hypothetical protein